MDKLIALFNAASKELEVAAIIVLVLAALGLVSLIISFIGLKRANADNNNVQFQAEKEATKKKSLKKVEESSEPLKEPNKPEIAAEIKDKNPNDTSHPQTTNTAPFYPNVAMQTPVDYAQQMQPVFMTGTPSMATQQIAANTAAQDERLKALETQLNKLSEALLKSNEKPEENATALEQQQIKQILSLVKKAKASNIKTGDTDNMQDITSAIQILSKEIGNNSIGEKDKKSDQNASYNKILQEIKRLSAKAQKAEDDLKEIRAARLKEEEELKREKKGK